MYLDNPTFWTSLSDVIRTIGIVGMLGALGFILKLVWGARGKVDDFVAGLVADRALAQRTYNELTAAKNEALMKVTEATAHGEAKAAELALKIETNEVLLNEMNKNHLFHIENDMREMNGKQDKVIESLASIDKNIAILVDRTPRQ